MTNYISISNFEYLTNNLQTYSRVLQISDNGINKYITFSRAMQSKSIHILYTNQSRLQQD